MKNFKSGVYIQQNFYKSFQPNKICKNWELDDMDIIMMLSNASNMLGQLNMFSEYIPDIDLFISMHIKQEASESNRIEGTQTHFDEVVKDEADIPEERRDDWNEVQNYIKAINYGIERLSSLPMSCRLIREIHKFLLDGVRGKHKHPGEFRTSQNWIGGATINDASFVPPHQDTVLDLMGDLESFIHSNIQIPELIKIAIIHYQFETIHPFLDGNGRVGRLLIPLFLKDCGLITKPILYMSDFFERNRQIYYDKLNSARVNNDISGWIKFFLVGIQQTAKRSIKAFDTILKLKAKTSQDIQSLGRKTPSAQIIINYLYGNPIVKVSKVCEILKISTPTAYSLLRDLVRLGILEKQPKVKGKEPFYAFRKYIDAFVKPLE